MKHVKEYKKICIVGLGIVTIFTIGSWETIPYSKRKHFVLIPPSKDTSFGNFISRTREEIFVLPQDHPDSVRVRSISNKILRALQSDLKIKEMTGLEYSSRNITSDVDEKEAAVPWWRRTKFSTRHLEGLDWEVVVVDRYLNNAYVLPGGKIVVYKYLLKSCKSDDQVAAVIDHEVGHVVARHYAERFTKSLWFAIGLMIIFSGGSGRSPPPHPLGTRKLAELVLNPCSRRVLVHQHMLAKVNFALSLTVLLNGRRGVPDEVEPTLSNQKMTDPFSVLSIGSIITSRTLIFQNTEKILILTRAFSIILRNVTRILA
ncbi:mitochondrial metalloendopeptidase OMA1-like isoform X1 [Daucus carota subsp. sativus]|uniref:mitochondrial metalloendopeptidase OMA1-like isoform X1 n=1 Tax=Daucus carota subsp. sativus TaxID=79200 RepID=UPI0007EFCFD4|nr:PREDICTED: mitochondrial metalloendopeptidase OMA1-like [Daucus carota subsp. sativus]